MTQLATTAAFREFIDLAVAQRSRWCGRPPAWERPV